MVIGIKDANIRQQINFKHFDWYARQVATLEIVQLFYFVLQ